MKSKFNFSRTLSLMLVIFLSLGVTQYAKAAYCTPNSPSYTATYNIGIQNVTLGTVGINATVVNNTTTMPPSNGYNVYSDYSATMNVTSRGGDNFAFSIRNGSGNQQQLRIWIDWNGDQSFDNTNPGVAGSEFIYDGATIDPGATITGSITVPCGKAAGTYRIRIAIGRGAGQQLDPCTGYIAEYEDYSLVLTAPPTLDLKSTSIVTTNPWVIGNNTLTLNYTNNGSTTVTVANFGYILDGGTPVVLTSQTITSGIAACASKQFSFPSPMVLSKGAHTLKVWVNTPNGTNPDNIVANDTFKTILGTVMSGTYVIDPSGSFDFKSFKEATDVLFASGINAPVLIKVNAGTYNEQVTLNPVPGLSAVNTLTFDGGTGNAATRIIQYSATAAANSHVFQINNCSYVTIKNLKMVSNGASYGCGVHVYGVCNSTVIKNNIITYGASGLSATGSTFMGIAVLNTVTTSSIGSCSSSPAATFDILIDSNTITGGGWGIQATPGGTNAAGISGLIISNNILTNVYYGIIHSSEKGISVKYNIIIGKSGAQQGIYGCNGSTSGNQIYEYVGNQIYNFNSYGIGASTMNPGGTPRNKIVNNLIAHIGNSWAIYMPYEKNFDCWHNSIYCSSASSTSSGGLYLSQSTSYGNWSIRNNNIALMSTSTTGYPLYFVATSNVPANVVAVEWNNYYKANTANQSMVYNGGIIYTTSNMQGADGMNNKFLNVPPNFISVNDLHYLTTVPPIYGDPTLGITTDCDKEPRCAIAPSIGGDESKYVAPTPNTNFSSLDTVYKKNLADFINPSSASAPYIYKWYLNGGLKATTLNWSNTFATVGTYKVKLVAEAYCGTKDSTEKSIVVIDPVKAPIADFLANTNFARTIDNVYLYDQSQNGCFQWRWSIFPATVYDPNTGANEATYRFVNSTNPSSQNPVIVLKYTGQYTICLRVTNNLGADSICKQDFIVVRTALNMCSQSVSNSNYGVLYDDGGPTANYSNNKSCNFLITPCSPNLTLTLKSFNLVTGDYLRIYDGVDNTGIKLYNSTLFPLGYTGDKNVTPTIPTTIVSTTGKIYMEYVTDGATASTGFEIEWDGAPKVVSNPKASFVMSDTTICKGRKIFFTNTSTGYGNKYYWDLDGDGIVDATTVNTSYTYLGTGTYEVGLIVENCGGIDTSKKVITALSPTTKPVVEFEADILNPGIGTDIVTFIDKSYRCADQWEWTITPSTITYRNATTKNSMNPQVSFNAKGCYTVKLVASCNGSKDSLTKTCFIDVLNYCVPVISTFSRDIGISRVQLGSINNTTDITSVGYTNYSKQYSTNMFITFPYTITIDRLTAFNNMSIYVWIDYNNDGDFFDAGEKVASTESNPGLTWSARFTVPATATEGKARMRIGTNFENLPNLPCGANLYGEYEDYYVNLQKDHQKPVITLIGAPSVVIEQGTAYSDPGVIVTDNMDTNISSKVVTKNTVNTAIIGVYYVTYKVTDASGNVADSVFRKVEVTLDITPPELTLTPPDTMYVEVYTPFTDPGFISIDKPWGTNLTSTVVVTGNVDTAKVGMYVITYKSTDAYGNSTTKERVVFIVDSQLPVILLNGSNPSSVEVYNKFIDPGFIVSDNYCATASLKPTITGNLDTSKLGTYSYIYNLTDCNGNGPVVVTRTVIVYDSTKPVLTFAPGEDTLDVEVNSQFADPGITIKDNYYTNLGNVITGTFYSTFPLGVPKTLGYYTIVYTATDGSSNVGVATRVINVVDTKAPVINLVGNDIVYVKACQWPNYVDQGYTVTDNYYAPAAILIDTVFKFTNSLDSSHLHKVQYKATDGSGNVAYSDVRYIQISGVSGVTEDMDRFISVYPNPAEGMVTINITLPTNENLSVRLFDILGKEKMNIFDGNIQSKTISLDLSSQTKGVYFVRFTYNNESFNKMLIIR